MNPGSNLNARKLRTGKSILQSDAIIGGATLDSPDKGKSNFNKMLKPFKAFERLFCARTLL